MGNLFDDIGKGINNLGKEVGKIAGGIGEKFTPIEKKEVDEFKLLVAELAFLSESFFNENKNRDIFLDKFPPKLAGALGGLRAGGIVPIAAAIAAPVVLVGGGVYHIANQNKLGQELEELFKDSITFENILEKDEREKVKELLIATKAYRKKLSDKHPDLKRIED